MPIHKGRLQKSGDSFRLHSFLIQPTTSLRCLNLRMAMAPGVSDWNWSIRDNERRKPPDAAS